MDKKTLTQIRVGIFVSLGLLLTMIVIFLLGGERNLFERHYILNARFPDISGLRLGAPVHLAGISVGTVEDIRFPTVLEEKEVIVKLEILRKYRDRIREDSEATISTQGLLGDKIILVTVGTPTSDELKEGDFLKTKESLSLDNIAVKGHELIDQLGEISKKLNGILSDVKEKKSFLHSLVYDYQGQDIISDLAAVSRSTSRMLRQIEGGPGMLHAMIYDKADPQMMKNLSVALGNMKNASQNINQMTAKIEKGEGSIGGLINDPTLYYDLKTLLGRANRSKLIQAVIRYTLSQNEKDTLK